jgi:D-serine ammonia-lyase
MPESAPYAFPTPSAAALQIQFVGKKLQEIQAPAAVIDAAVVRRNCKLMLDATAKLGVGFRAHVKTHKVGLVYSLPSRREIDLLYRQRR